MKKKLFILGMLLLITGAMPVIMSCGGSDDEEEKVYGPDNDFYGSYPAYWIKGVHRVEVTFIGDINEWKIDEIAFSACMDDGGLTNIRDLSGEGEYKRYISYYHPKGIRNYTVESKDDACCMNAGVTLKPTSANAKPLTVKVAFSVDGKKLFHHEHKSDPEYKRSIISVHSNSRMKNDVIYDNYD